MVVRLPPDRQGTQRQHADAAEMLHHAADVRVSRSHQERSRDEADQRTDADERD